MINLLKKPYLVLLLALLFPVFVFAANDVTFSNGSQIQLTISGGGTMTLIPTDGDQVDSISVSEGTITLGLSQNSTFTATSSTTKWLQATPGTYVTSTSCTSSQSSIAISKTDSGTASLTITVGDTCGQETLGGGGPGPDTTSITTTTTTTTEEEAVSAEEEPAPLAVEGEPVVEEEIPAALPTPVFPKVLEIKSTLKRGMENANVRALQEALASDSEIYPEGLITGYYGPLTEKAVQRFQAKYGIVSSGTPETTGYGLVGPKTRAKLHEVFGGAVQKAFSQELDFGMQSDDVKRLQEYLAKDPELYPEGLTTGYYGPLTTAAVRRFQAKYGIAQVGRVGPQTLAKLNELMGATPAPAGQEPAAKAEEQQKAAIQSQISDLQALIEQIQAQINALQQQKKEVSKKRL